MMAHGDLDLLFHQMVRQKLPDQPFNAWFRPLAIDAVTDGEVTIAVPTRFAAEWVRDHYGDLVVATLKDLGHDEVRVVYRVQENAVEEAANPTATVAEEVPVPQSARSTEGLRTDGSILNGRYTFETFVVGASNQLAHAASLAVADNPSRAYNPLFIYGGVGLGKTHLLTAIGHRMTATGSAERVCYLSAERFMNELINSIRFDRMGQFRDKFRLCDALLIDDIQFIAGKERTQEEFFHTFNALYDLHRQIVVSSDRFPKEIPGIEERLRSRFEMGLVADIQPPDLETKVAILTKKAAQDGIALPQDVALFLATAVTANVRELEGALIRLAAFASLTAQPITVDLARDVLKDLLRETQAVVTVADVQRMVASFYKVKVADLKSPRKLKAITVPRQVAMYIARALTHASFPDLGREFGNKDHSTVIHAVRRIEERVQREPALRHEVQILMNALRT